jgi:hypothetical protein
MTAQDINEELTTIPAVKDLPDFSEVVESPTAKIFQEQIIKPGYKYGMSTDEELKKKGATGKGLTGEKEIDCSGAICKVLKVKGIDRGNPLIGNNAQTIHNDSKSVKAGEEKDGDLITFKTEGKGVDHIGFLVIDKKTGKKFIAESSRSFNQGKIVPFAQRIQFLQEKADSLGNKLEYSIRRL